MPLPDQNLEELVRLLHRRPGHDSVKSELHRLLVEHFGQAPHDIYHEERIEARSRVDTLLGDTVFEIKRDLRQENEDAREQLTRYLENRERITGRSFCGIATDGRNFEAYELRDGALTLLGHCEANPETPRRLTIWLESILSLSAELPPTSLTVISELGRHSAAYAHAQGVLRRAWARLQDHPSVRLKRDLWNQHLQIVYGLDQDDDDLWFQHSFLVIVAKAFAHCAIDLQPRDGSDLLSGESLRSNGIGGAIEADFFDWVLEDPESESLVTRILSRVRRFRLADVGMDLLKVLYESLIDPEQRHELGEYYTPDWLARKMVAHHIDQPLIQVTLDPSCGSGTFLFHAVRQVISEAKRESYGNYDILHLCLTHVLGVDVHPVAIIIARVTYLLALGPDVLEARHGPIALPVYLGDAMQWNVRPMMEKQEIVLRVPPVEAGQDPDSLAFPAAAIDVPDRFEMILDTMVEASEKERKSPSVRKQLARITQLDATDLSILTRTYETLKKLQRHGRNHIWAFVARNMARPLWLSRRQIIDRVIGNPPWLSFRYMSPALKRRAQESMRGYDIWVGGNQATHQDLSACFFARCADLYLRREGRIAFLMPLAAMTRGHGEKFRRGQFSGSNVAFDDVWTFDDCVTPLFPVPSCAMFARRTALARRVPETVTAYAGILPYRNVDEAEADRRLTAVAQSRPGEASFHAATPYRGAFRQGATLVPRMLCYVTRGTTGRIGAGHRLPVQSWRSPQEKSPWKELPSLTGFIERPFLKVALLGESVAPHRVLQRPEAVIPYEDGVLSSEEAYERGYTGLADWLEAAERLWRRHSSGKMSFLNQINFWGKLSSQFPMNSLRVVFCKAGMKQNVCFVRGTDTFIDHKLYWCAVHSEPEGHYLSAVLNSETARQAVEHLQSRGQWGARDFDKVMFTLPIPPFDPAKTLHAELAGAAARAEAVAANVPLTGAESSNRARRAIRSALADEGVDREIDGLVSRLLFGEAAKSATRRA